MNISNGLALRNAALSLAAKQARTIELISVERLREALSVGLQDALARARNVLVLGISTPGLASTIVSHTSKECATVMLLETDAGLFTPTLLQPCGGFRGEITQHVCQDITNLRLDPDIADNLVSTMQPQDYAAYRKLEARLADQALAAPWVPDSSVDLVIVDMMANRLDGADFDRLLSEVFRILRRKGQLVFTALLADEQCGLNSHIDLGRWEAKRIPTEREPLDALERAGFHGMSYWKLLDRPTHIDQGIEINAIQIDAFKGKQGECRDYGHAVLYRGPWREVLDDDGHRYLRGERTAVCVKTYELLTRGPYRNELVVFPPYLPMNPELAPLFDCDTPSRRDPRVTKGLLSVFASRTGSKAKNKCCETGASVKSDGTASAEI